MKSFIRSLLFVVLSLLFFGEVQHVHAATKYWIGPEGGSFTDNSNWSTTSGGSNDTTAPGASDVATFNNGSVSNVSINSSISVSGIDIKSTYSGTITQAADVNVTVGSGALSIAGGNFTGSNGLITVSGTFTLSGGTFTASSATTTFSGAFTKTTGTYNANGGITEFRVTGSTPAISSGDASFNNVTFTGGAVSSYYYVDSNMTIAGNLQAYGTTGRATFMSRNSYSPVLSVAGDFLITGVADVGSPTAGNNLTISLAGNMSMINQDSRFYANMVFNGTGDQTITKTTGSIQTPSTWSSTKSSGTLTIAPSYNFYSPDRITWASGDLTIGDSANFSEFFQTGGTVTVGTADLFTGAFSLTGGTFVASSATTTFSHNFTKTTGTYNANGGITEFRGSYAGASISSGDASFNNVAFTGGSSTSYHFIDSNMTIAGNLQAYQASGFSKRASFLSHNSYNPTISVAGDFLITGVADVGSPTAGNNLTISLAGNMSMINQDSRFYANMVFNGTGDQTITKTQGTVVSSMSSTKESGSLTLTSFAGGNATNYLTWTGGLLLSAENLDFGSSNFTLSGGTFRASSATTTFSGNFLVTGGTFDHNNGIVSFFLNAGAIAVSSGDTVFNNVAFTGGGTAGYSGGDIYIDSDMNISGNMRVYSTQQNGTYIRSRNNLHPTITVSGNLDLPSASKTSVLGWSVDSDNLNINLGGNLSMSYASDSLYAPIIFTGTGDQTITKTAGTIGAGSTWTITKNSGRAVLGSALTHPSTITVTSGILDLAGSNLTVTSALTINSGATLQLQGGETVTTPTLDVGSTVIYNGGGNYASLRAGDNYHHLTFDGTGNWTLDAALDINGNLTITRGSVLAAGNSITLAGNWSNSDTFTHDNNTVTLDGTNQTITGSANTAFYNLIKSVSTTDTLIFNNERTTTITHNTTLKGASDNLLLLRSDLNGTQSEINVSNTGTRDVQYLNVQDNNNTNATALVCYPGCVDSENG